MIPKKTYVYIAGPYRAPKDGMGKATDMAVRYHRIDNHITTARTAAAILAQMGIPFFCPHLNGAHFEVIVPEVPDTYWLDLGLALVAGASAMWLLPDWQNSSGTDGEMRLAKTKLIPVFKPYELKELVEWWETGL